MKKIDISELRIGMYVEDFCMPWLKSPFWSLSLLVDTPDKLARIIASNIVELVIDPSRGVDIALAPSAGAATAKATLSKAVPFRYPPVVPTSMATELERAAQLLTESKTAVSSMFHEARMGNAVAAEQVRPLVDEIAMSVMRNPDALVGLVRLKHADEYTYMHSVAVCALMIALARQLKMPDAQVRELGLAGLMHDIGKMLVPQDILNKPGDLTQDEFTAIKDHPEAGHRLLLAGNDVSEVVLDVCLHHHEKMNGTGYPAGLAGDAISVAARMGAICDVYDAITSDRPYKSGWCPATSLSKMMEWCNGHFDPDILGAFIKCMGIYPVGTVVKMQSGRLAVIADHGLGKSLIAPTVCVFFCTNSKTLLVPELVNLAEPAVKDKILGREDAAKWGVGDTRRFWIKHPTVL